MKKLFKKVRNPTFIADLILTLGVILIVQTTFTLNQIIGKYLLGILLILLAFFLGKTTKKGGK